MPIRGQLSEEERLNASIINSDYEALKALESSYNDEVHKQVDGYFSTSTLSPTIRLKAIVRNLVSYQVSILYNKRNKYFRVRYDANDLPFNYNPKAASSYLFHNRKNVEENGAVNIKFSAKQLDWIGRYAQ